MIYSLLVLNLINSYVIFDFMNRMYAKKYESKKVYVFAYIVFTLIHLFVNSLKIVELNILYEVSCICLLGKILYKDIAKKKIYNISFALYLIFMDTISFPIYSMSPIQNFSQLLNESEYIIMTGAINYIIVICTYRLMIKYFIHRDIDAISIRQDIFFIVLAVVEIITIVYVWEVALKHSDVVLLFVSLSFIFLDLYILYLFEFVAKHSKLKHQIDLAEQQAIMFNRNIHDLERKYQKSQKIVHEVRNYLQILKKLRENDAEQLANKYSDQLNEKLNELEYRFQTSNPIMSILLNDTLLIAEEKEIKLKLKVKDIDWFFLKEIDLTTLFANLFNNAIEACENCSKQNRWIDLRIGETNQHVVIFISNPYQADKLINKNDSFVSTKKGHSGIGLSNIQNVVDKYNGNLLIDTNDNIFTVKIILPQKKC